MFGGEFDGISSIDWTDKAYRTYYGLHQETDGIHTINSDDNIVVFDGKRFVFTFSGFKQQLKQKLYK